MMNQRYYMDWNATAPLHSRAQSAMLEALAVTGNPSSIHADGRKARAIMEKARSALASFLNIRPQNVIFTASGTEANNLALNNRAGMPVFVSAIEHESVMRPALRQKARLLPVTKNGVVDLEALEKELANVGGPAFVSVMLANNETGVIQPVADIAALVHRYFGLLHCDASQAVNKIEINVEAMGADMVSLSSHKAGGPVGAGALVLRSERVLQPLLQGGGQERSRRAGTENIAAIAGFAAILNAYDFSAANKMRDFMQSELSKADPSIVFFGAQAPRMPNTLCFAGSHRHAEGLLIGFDLAGFSISAGAACSSGKLKPSHVVEAMGFGSELAEKSLRVSLGPMEDRAAIEAFVACWRELNGLAIQDPFVQRAGD